MVEMVIILLLVLILFVWACIFNKVIENYKRQLADKQRANEVLLQQVTVYRSVFSQADNKKL